jgi:hypothetical protein
MKQFGVGDGNLFVVIVSIRRGRTGHFKKVDLEARGGGCVCVERGLWMIQK